MESKKFITLGKIGHIEEGKMSLTSAINIRLAEKRAQEFNSYKDVNYNDMDYKKSKSPKTKTK